MARNLGSIAAGFLSMMFVWLLLMVILFMVGRQLAPDEFVLPAAGEEAQAPQGIGWLLATLAVDAAAAALGGLVVAIVATGRRWMVVKITAGLLAVACALQLMGDVGLLPFWLPLARTVVAPAALLLAGRGWLGAAAGTDTQPSKLPGPSASSTEQPPKPVSKDT